MLFAFETKMIIISLFGALREKNVISITKTSTVSVKLQYVSGEIMCTLLVNRLED